MSNGEGELSGISPAALADTSDERLMVVVPDPAHLGIDESEAIRAFIARGIVPIVVTCATADSASALEHDRTLAALGVRDHRFLGADGARMTDLAPRTYGIDPPSADSIQSADIGEIAADLATVIAITGARAVILLTPSRRSNGESTGTADVTARAARRAAQVMSAPLFVRDADSVGSPPQTNGTPPQTKESQLSDHPSRVSVGSYNYARTDAEASASPISGRRRGAAARVAATAVAAGVGIAIGALGTVTQAWTWSVGDADLPVGLAAGLVVVAALLLGLRLLFDTRTNVLAAAIGLLAVIALLSVESAGGSVLVPDRVLSYGWIYGPVLIALVIVAWPRIDRTRPAAGPGTRAPAPVGGDKIAG